MIPRVLHFHFPFQMPETDDEWLAIAARFKQLWQFDHCIGALDGKHIQIKSPNESGTYYYNYKQYFSIVLLALVDADYRFIMVDIGCNGRNSDGGVLRNSTFGKKLLEGNMLLPQSVPLPGRTRPVPHVIVADDAFPLKDCMLKPFSGTSLDSKRRIFNYRLSRARRVVENAFGILANRFRVLLTTINLEPEKVERIVLAACSLHNFLRRKCAQYAAPGFIDTETPTDRDAQNGQWRTQRHTLPPIGQQGSNNYAGNAKQIREEFADYFVSDLGQVSWQSEMI